MKTCKYCGKSINAFYSKITPDSKIPEIKKPLYFCSATCQNRFVGSIKANRKKNVLKELRTKLEKSNAIYTREDVPEIYATLTRKEKLHIFILSN